MEPPIHRTATSAWDHLVRYGGLELEGRDEGLDQCIRAKLDLNALSLFEALKNATLEAFCQRFFEAAIHPYVEMMQGILRFFERASAHEGPQQWVLQIDNVEASLAHFRQWIKSWQEVGAQFHVPAVDWQGAWDLLRALRSYESVQASIQAAFDHHIEEIPPDIQGWVSAYQQGRYDPLTERLSPSACPPALRTTATIILAALTKLRDKGYTRPQLLEHWRGPANKMRKDEADAFDFGSLGQNEDDYWLRSMVVAFAAACNLPKDMHQKLDSVLSAITDRYPLRPFNAKVTWEHLESILSLPIWKKRYELYAVWGACEMVDALDGHQYEIHHQNGRLEFAFRETLLTTIRSAPQLFEFVSEKRILLANPRGHGRKAGVQPDYSVWALDGSEKVCRLVIECKHYKTSAGRRFSDVLDDYARALLGAEVYLVNHGPVGNAVYNVSDVVSRRCHAIGNLTPSHWEARTKLRAAVRSCVGEPIEPWSNISADSGSPHTIIALDVSPSMKDILDTPGARALVRRIANQEQVEFMAAVDTRVRGLWIPADINYEQLCQTPGAGTALAEPTNELLQRAERVIVITDDDGARTLQPLEPISYPIVEAGLSSLRVLECRRT